MALGCLALAACSTEQPSAPRLHSLTGQVQLTGYLLNEDGTFAGTRVVENPSGVAVELVHGSAIVGRTTTVGGSYRFSGLGPGDYVARVRVVGTLGGETLPLVIATTDVAVARPLQVVSTGDLVVMPNPFVDTTQVHFGVPQEALVEVSILDLSGRLVRSLLATNTVPGRYGLVWNGLDEKGVPTAGATYWVTYACGQDYRAHLLFRQGMTPRGSGRSSARPQ